MCQYWSKLHTCSHVSDRPYVEMCHPGFIANIVCKDIGTDEEPRPSYFPCYKCIKAEARAETLERMAQERVAVLAAEAAREQADKVKAETEKRVREERVRREAREKADRERAAELRVKAEREAERRTPDQPDSPMDGERRADVLRPAPALPGPRRVLRRRGTRGGAARR